MDRELQKRKHRLMTQAGTRIFESRVAVVTGAGNGIGRAEAIAFASLGARVVVNDLARGNPTSAERVVEEIRAAGGEALAANASVSKAEGAAAIVSTAVDAWGRLDFLVNNAGFGRVSPIWETTETEWDTVISVNLKGSFLMAREASRVMRAQKFGVIINTSSESATGDNYFTSYMAAKEGVVGLTRGIARDLLRDNVRCNAIRPRAFDTLQGTPVAWEKLKRFRETYGVSMSGPHPMGPVQGKAAEVAAIVAWLCSDDAVDITGRIFVAGCGEVGMWAEPTVVQPLINMDGWSLETLHAVRHLLSDGMRSPLLDLPTEAWDLIDDRYRGMLERAIQNQMNEPKTVAS